MTTESGCAKSVKQRLKTTPTTPGSFWYLHRYLVGKCATVRAFTANCSTTVPLQVAISNVLHPYEFRTNLCHAFYPIHFLSCFRGQQHDQQNKSSTLGVKCKHPRPHRLSAQNQCITRLPRSINHVSREPKNPGRSRATCHNSQGTPRLSVAGSPVSLAI